jgi:hypothetical protein
MKLSSYLLIKEEERLFIVQERKLAVRGDSCDPNRQQNRQHLSSFTRLSVGFDFQRIGIARIFSLWKSFDSQDLNPYNLFLTIHFLGSILEEKTIHSNLLLQFICLSTSATYSDSLPGIRTENIL